MFRKLCALEVTGTKFYVSGHGARKYFGKPELKKKKYLSEFLGPNLESISHHVTKIFI